MKKLIWSAAVMCLWVGAAVAQTGNKKSKAITKTKAIKAGAKDSSIVLINSSANAAYGKNKATNLYIADPTIRIYNNRSFTDAKPDNARAIIGIPKLRTGVVHGQMIFYSTTSATSGTSTGSGAVGTGTSLGNVGTSGAGIGVNGKNPYAGPGIYGTRVISDLRPKAAWAKPSTTNQ